MELKMCVRCNLLPPVDGKLFCLPCQRMIEKMAETAKPTGHPDIPAGD